ncbi:CRISPR-associated endonuclease Cas2 [Laspinema olomoucense]|uniref:CRISPR-associated endoribonuclease Cas2 n=1 Tax=Laspinema olomoucense D3b TaxID=2953688 RepID=A0ABT2N4H8_9CYAN|nr:CRISPR-associated endonuclease Cas2 [Laspinema sp. D3b]MCT7977593.1 CRISPR-associated endonuclease Cas2 [Laspinema sp. D3b]
MFYLICYDITEDNRRNRVAKVLETYGMRVQQSVFEAVLNETEYHQLQARLLKLLNKRQDQLRFYPLSPANRDRIVILGRQPEFTVDALTFIV